MYLLYQMTMVEGILITIVGGIVVLLFEHYVLSPRRKKAIPKGDKHFIKGKIDGQGNKKGVSGEQLAAILKKEPFDSDRVRIAVDAINGVSTITGDELAKILESFTFDEGRIATTKLLNPKIDRPISDEEYSNILSKITFSSGKKELDRVLCSIGIDEGEQRISGKQLTKILSKESSDDEKILMLIHVLDGVQAITGRELAKILENFKRDDERVTAVKLLIKKVSSPISDSNHSSILEQMSGNDSKKEITRVLFVGS